MKVFVYSARPYDTPALQAAAGKYALQFTDKPLRQDTAHLAESCQAVALFSSDDASAAVLEKLYGYGIRFILLRSAGYDHVDLLKATALGMRVANVPAYSPYSVAEHAVAMLLAINRRIVVGQHLMDQQDFRIDGLKGFLIHGSTVGVIGTGSIGIAFARIMLGFGAHVLAYDPEQNTEAIDAHIKYVSMQDLLRDSDVVSLHCPLTPATKHMISSAQFDLMKPGAILVNTSRGAVINTHDLIAALDSGKLGGACLDTYEFEKGLFFEDHSSDILHDTNFVRLRSFKNVLITSHQGFLTTDAIEQIAEVTFRNLDAFGSNTRCQNELTTSKISESVANPSFVTSR
jgi:D-lactate dehydrogenase